MAGRCSSFSDSPVFPKLTTVPDWKPPMMVSTPHYLLCSETTHGQGVGQWRFTLRTADGSRQLEAADVEPSVGGERLDLLTVVRALEALDQPSRVTLVGCSPYVRQGIRYGLPEWRSNGWRWEYFGQMVPVKNGDLWQRLDRAMRFHHVECRRRRLDAAHASLAGPTLIQHEPQPMPRVDRITGLRGKAEGWLRWPGLPKGLGDWRSGVVRLRLWWRGVVSLGRAVVFWHLRRADR